MRSNTGCNSPGDALMMRNTSAVAFSRSSASSRSRKARAVSVFWLVTLERRTAVDFGRLARFGAAALRRPALPVLPPAFERRFIALPPPRQTIVAGQAGAPEVAFAAQ